MKLTRNGDFVVPGEARMLMRCSRRRAVCDNRSRGSGYNAGNLAIILRRNRKRLLTRLDPAGRRSARHAACFRREIVSITCRRRRIWRGGRKCVFVKGGDCGGEAAREIMM